MLVAGFPWTRSVGTHCNRLAIDQLSPEPPKAFYSVDELV